MWFFKPNIEKLTAENDIRGLIKALKYNNDDIRVSAAKALGNIGDKRAIEPLMETLHVEEQHVRRSAADALAQMGESGLEPLFSALKSDDPDTRKAAAQDLGQFSDPRVVEPLIEALHDKDAGVRAVAAGGLSLAKDPRAIGPLIAKLKDEDEEYPVRALAGTSLGLGEFEDSRPIDVLIETLSNDRETLSNEQVLLAHLATKFLGAMGDERAVGPLCKALDQPSDFMRDMVRKQAAQSLGEIGDPRAIGALSAKLQDPNEEVRAAVKEALAMIEKKGGKRPTAESDPLVLSLASNDEPTFLNGLTQAVALADSGDRKGVDAMRAAIKLRSGREDVRFYEPGVIFSTSIDRYTEARPKIVALAQRNALLDDVYVSGDLVSAFLQLTDHEQLRSLLHEIYAVGGPSEGYAFQLLFNEMRCSAKISAGL